MSNFDKLKKITTLVFDVDGVFTDGTLLVGEQEVQRVFHVRDGYAIQMALKAGLKVAIISGGKQESIRQRLSGLGVKDIFLSVGTDQKRGVLISYVQEQSLSYDEIAYMGDDIPDLLLMQNQEIFKACPKDAVPELIEICDYVSPTLGGKGAVRDLIELIMKAQGTWLTVF